MKKYTYKSSGIKWLGDIPNHWKVDRVKDVSSLRDEKVKIKSAEYNYLELENLEQGTGKVISFKNTLEVGSAVMRYKKGDVLFGKLRPYLEKYYYTMEDGYCTGEILAIEPKRIEGRFLKYFFSSPNFISQCVVFSYGTKMPRINWQKQIGIFYLPLPPIQEQKNVADYLDIITDKLDRILSIKQEQLDKIESSLKSKVKELITLGIQGEKTKKTDIEWFSDIPKSWKTIRLKSVVSKVNSGVTPKGGATAYVEEGVPLIRSQNVVFDGLDLDDVVFIKEITHDKMKNSKVFNGDVLLNITGASIGRTCYVENIEEANVNQHVCIIRPFQFITTKYLYYLLFSEVGQAQVFSGFKGSGREGLNFESIKTFKLPLPPSKDEQNQITEKLDDLIKVSRKSRDNIISQIKTMRDYRNSLIQECVTGKKQVCEAYIEE